MNFVIDTVTPLFIGTFNYKDFLYWEINMPQLLRIEVFSNLMISTQRLDVEPKLNRFKERLEKASKNE